MKKRLITIFSAAILLGVPVVAYAGLLPSCATGAGDCHTCDFITFFVNLMQMSLSAIAGVVLLMFVVGGVFWIVSSGNAEQVKKGQKIMIGALIGLGFVMGSWMIVHVTIAAFMGADFDNVKLFGTNWYEYCEEGMTPEGALKSCAAVDGVSVVGSPCLISGTCEVSGGCFCDATEACVSDCVYQAAEGGGTGSCLDTTAGDATQCSAAKDSWNDTMKCPENQRCCVTSP